MANETFVALLQLVPTCQRYANLAHHPRAYSNFYHSLCLMLSWRNIMSAAVSPDKQLRFDVTTKPACENKRSDAADEAWTARYLRASLAMRGYSISFCLHARGVPRRSTVSSVTSATLFVLVRASRHRCCGARRRCSGLAGCCGTRRRRSALAGIFFMTPTDEPR